MGSSDLSGVCALVPMRHDSERVPGKNYRSFCGRPLFHHILATLIASRNVDRIIVDTDSPTIRSQVDEHFPGVEVWERPAHLRDGEVPMTEVLQHDARRLDHEWLLQTHSTNPLLRASTIERAADALRENPSHDSLFSVTRLQTRLYDAGGAPINHDPNVLLRTQDLPPVYEENSNLYLFPRKLILERGRRIGDRPMLFEVDPIEATDIDTESDFVVAEKLCESGVVGA
jgi:CMP-N-acetylneuraminic acid synthetase